LIRFLRCRWLRKVPQRASDFYSLAPAKLSIETVFFCSARFVGRIDIGTQLLNASQKPCLPSCSVPTTVIFSPTLGIISLLNLAKAGVSFCAAAAIVSVSPTRAAAYLAVRHMVGIVAPITVVTSPLHLSSRLRNEIEAENLVGRVCRRYLLRGCPVRAVWTGLGYRIRIPPLMLT
jgi:hypothetical protein